MILTVRAIDISVYVMTSLKWRLEAFPWNLGLSHSSAPHVFLPLASPMGPSSPKKDKQSFTIHEYEWRRLKSWKVIVSSSRVTASSLKRARSDLLP